MSEKQTIQPQQQSNITEEINYVNEQPPIENKSGAVTSETNVENTVSDVQQESLSELTELDAKPSDDLQQRLQKEAAQRKTLETKLASVEKELQQSQTNEAFTDPETGQEIALPDKNDYTDAKDYLEALVQHQKKIKQVELQQQQHQVQQQILQQKAQQFQHQEQAARERYVDYDKVAHADIPVTELMAHVMMESKKGADILYWLGQNPQESYRLAQLSQQDPIKVAMELGKLEARIATLKKTQSNAPAPIQLIHNSTSAQVNLEQMNTDDLINYLYEDN